MKRHTHRFPLLISQAAAAAAAPVISWEVDNKHAGRLIWSLPPASATCRTFLGGPGRPGFAVHALELVEERPHFDLVHDALLEAGEDDAALGRHLHVLRLPDSWRGQPRGLAVHHPVALDELGLAIHLQGGDGVFEKLPPRSDAGPTPPEAKSHKKKQVANVCTSLNVLFCFFLNRLSLRCTQLN